MNLNEALPARNKTGSVAPMVICGVFSFNESVGVTRVVNQILEQQAGAVTQIIILDDSEIPSEVAAIDKLTHLDQKIRVVRGENRPGKVYHLNLLLSTFLGSDADYLLHFDSDLTLGDSCLEGMVAALRSGYEVVTADSLSYPGRNLFERAERILTRTAEMSRQAGIMNLPLIGHNAGYSKLAARLLWPIPHISVNEEVYALTLLLRHKIPCTVIPGAVVRFRLPAGIEDYVKTRRRVVGREAKATQLLGSEAEDALRRVYPVPPPGLVGRAIAEDPFAALFLPYIVALRVAASASRLRNPSAAWDISSSTKR